MKVQQAIWKNNKMIPWETATTHVLTHGLHYGSSVFEGIRVYKTANGPAIFKLAEHIDRFMFSAEQLGMKMPYTAQQICEAVVETVHQNGLEEGYIRPLAYYGQGSMKVVPDSDVPVEVMIACWPWGDYLETTAVDIAISPYIRIHPKSTVASAKIGGHYVNSILSGLTIRNTHYHEVLLLDSDGFVAEGSAENIFIVKDGKMITTPAGTILMGITRDTVMQIAAQFNIPVEERHFKPNEIYEADEAFFCGTAIEIISIRSLEDKLIAKGDVGSVTEKIKVAYHRIIRGEIPAFHNALTWVSDSKEKAA